MENITIGEVVASISAIMVILGFITFVYNNIKKNITDRISQNEKEISILKKDMEGIKAEVKDSKEERLILVNGVLACLKGLKEQGCNGSVNDGINQIEKYLMKKSHD